MNANAQPPAWPGLEVAGAARRLADAEGLLAVVFEDGEMLGSARETWRADATSPRTRDDDAEPTPGPETRGVLRIWLDRTVDIAHARLRLTEALIASAAHHDAAQALEVRPLSTPHEDWATAWREFFHPLRVTRRILILPAWRPEPDAAPAAEERPDVILRIEPGQAFGSGTHATTRVTLRALEGALLPDSHVLDFGAGSGILSFAALKLGARSATAVEIDPVCVENFRENATLNGLADAVDYRIGSTDALREGERYDLVLCNVLLERVADRIAALAGRLKPGGRLLLSGFLEEQREEAEECLKAAGLRVHEADREEEWGLCAAHAAPNGR